MSKNIKKFKPKDILEILWADSHHHSGWLTPEDAQDFVDSKNQFIIHTIGYFFSEDKIFIYLIQSQDTQESSLIDAIVGIPKGTILRINKLK